MGAEQMGIVFREGSQLPALAWQGHPCSLSTLVLQTVISTWVLHLLQPRSQRNGKNQVSFKNIEL